MSKETDRQNEDSAKVDPPPGPADHGREGGMATRENAPELTEPDRGD
ncbi:hypothetical protein [Mycobacterium sp. ACS1612]|nr:hypothetical protein [Mycobacterium sp. ACS1612]